MNAGRDEVIVPDPARWSGPGEPVLIDSLLPPADFPRAGQSAEYVRLLAECEEALPPIVVHRPTRQVIDGMHRLAAARLRGDDVIQAVFADGSPAEMFVLAVELNRAHGLPLTVAERRAAATRIVALHPHWSDRRIARTTGLAASTVACLRSVNTGAGERRTGQDGRSRPVDATDGRRRASELLTRNPNASVREVARTAGISLGTASDVRARLRRGEPAMTVRQQDAEKPGPTRGGRRTGPDRDRVLERLRKDPSLRFTAVGRLLIGMLGAAPDGSIEQIEQIAECVPEHWRDIVIGLARESATAWHRLANRLEGRDAGRRRSTV